MTNYLETLNAEYTRYGQMANLTQEISEALYEVALTMLDLLLDEEARVAKTI